MTELIGHKLGQYDVTAQLGKGGMATVYQATQASMKRTVAIKILPRALTHEEKFLERFYREVQIAASLQHPHILPVYDFGQYEELPYIVMAYMSGGTLADLMAHGPMDNEMVLRTVNQMASALEYAHSKGVIHRDFKPGNVLLDENRNTYLTDFGLAKMSESSGALTGTGILGTPTYMSPEQSEPGELTPAADIYALGITVFQMLTGHAPFEAATPLGVLMAHLTHPIPDVRSLRAELNDGVQAVIDRSMAKKPEDRYQRATELADALAEAMGQKIHTSASIQAEGANALLMTNMVGQVIFVDQPCLRVLKRHHNEARSIIGKPLSEVLGIDRSVADEIIRNVGKAGKIEQQRLDIRDARSRVVSVLYSAMATRDDKGAFVGADITLQTIPDVVVPPSDEFTTIDRRMATTDESFLQTYFAKQLQSLRQALVQWGGNRMGANLDRIINETAQRNVWAVSMNGDKIDINIKANDADVYRALLAKAIAFAVNLVGKKIVMKSMQSVDGQIEPTILNVVEELKLYDLFDVL
ncbi:MAG: serine/threonine-protein kinase [Anaerolineae bacterium]